MLRKLRKAVSLSAGDRWLLAQAWLLLLAVDIGLRMLPFLKLQGLLKQGKQVAVAQDTESVIRLLTWTVQVSARNHLYPMTCLRQALVLQWLLARNGVAAELRIGVRREGMTLDAHAWVEYQGRMIGQPLSTAEQFAPLLVRESEKVV